MTDSLALCNAVKRFLHIGQVRFNAVSNPSGHGLIKKVPHSAVWAFVAACFKLAYSSLTHFVTVRAGEVNFGSSDVHFLTS